MEMKPVTSSNVESVGYNLPTRELNVKFKNNDRIYRFADVPDDLVARFMEAESKGKFFGRNIRGKFQSPAAQGE